MSDVVVVYEPAPTVVVEAPAPTVIIGDGGIPLGYMGAPLGVATLDASGFVPLAQLPGAAALDAEITAAVAAEAVLRQAADTTLGLDITAAVEAEAVLREAADAAHVVGHASGDATVVHLTGAETITGPKTFLHLAGTGAALQVKAVGGQATDLQQWLSSAAVVLAKVLVNGSVVVNSGSLSAGGDPLTSVRMSSFTSSAGVIGLVVRGYAAQTSDLQQWHDSAGAALAVVSPSGTFRMPALTNPTNVGPFLTFGTTELQVINRTTPGNTPFIVRGMAAQTADLTRWQDSALAVVARVTATGHLGLGGASASTSQLAVVTDAVGTIGVIVQGVASQSADLQRWQDSAGAVLSWITSTGNLVFSNTKGAFFTMASGNQGYVAGNGANQLDVRMGTGGLRVLDSTGATVRLQVTDAGAVSIPSGGTLSVISKSTLGNIDFLNPGIGTEARFEFLKTNDFAWMSVLEHTSDNTTWTFGQGDNPDGGDVMRWYMQDYQGIGGDWEPLRLEARTVSLKGKRINAYGEVVINSPYITGGLLGGRFGHQNSGTPGGIYTNEAGTLSLTVNASVYSGSSSTVYWVLIDGTGTPNTFSWGTGSLALGGAHIVLGTAVPITGAAQALNNGITVTFSGTTGGVLNDGWQFTAYPSGRLAVGGALLANVITSVYCQFPTSIGLVVKAAAAQSVNLQEWHESTGTVRAAISPFGQLSLGSPATPISSARITVKTVAATSEGIIVQGVASQTADLEQWQSSAGTVLSKMSAAGNLEFTAATRGPILTSPTGVRYRLTVSDIGTLTAVPA